MYLQSLWRCSVWRHNHVGRRCDTVLRISCLDTSKSSERIWPSGQWSAGLLEDETSPHRTSGFPSTSKARRLAAGSSSSALHLESKSWPSAWDVSGAVDTVSWGPLRLDMSQLRKDESGFLLRTTSLTEPWSRSRWRINNTYFRPCLNSDFTSSNLRDVTPFSKLLRMGRRSTDASLQMFLVDVLRERTLTCFTVMERMEESLRWERYDPPRLTWVNRTMWKSLSRHLCFQSWSGSADWGQTVNQISGLVHLLYESHKIHKIQQN